MPAPLLAGDEIPASPETSYTPTLVASTTSPTLGSDSVQVGRYYVNPLTGWIHGQAVVRFGTSGTNAGSGNYSIELPTAADNNSFVNTLGLSDVIGWGTMRDNSATSASRLIVVSLQSTNGGTGGVAIAALQLLDGTNTNVTHAVPWAWTVSDGISIQFAYPGA